MRTLYVTGGVSSENVLGKKLLAAGFTIDCVSSLNAASTIVFPPYDVVVVDSTVDSAHPNDGEHYANRLHAEGRAVLLLHTSLRFNQNGSPTRHRDNVRFLEPTELRALLESVVANAKLYQNKPRIHK